MHRQQNEKQTNEITLNSKDFVQQTKQQAEDKIYKAEENIPVFYKGSISRYIRNATQ